MINRDKIVEIDCYLKAEDKFMEYRKPSWIRLFGLNIIWEHGGFYYFGHSINLPTTHTYEHGIIYEKPHIVIRLVDGSEKFYHYNTDEECIKEYENYKAYLK